MPSGSVGCFIRSRHFARRVNTSPGISHACSTSEVKQNASFVHFPLADANHPRDTHTRASHCQSLASYFLLRGSICLSGIPSVSSRLEPVSRQSSVCEASVRLVSPCIPQLSAINIGYVKREWRPATVDVIGFHQSGLLSVVRLLQSADLSLWM